MCHDQPVRNIFQFYILAQSVNIVPYAYLLNRTCILVEVILMSFNKKTLGWWNMITATRTYDMVIYVTYKWPVQAYEYGFTLYLSWLCTDLGAADYIDAFLITGISGTSINLWRKWHTCLLDSVLCVPVCCRCVFTRSLHGPVKLHSHYNIVPLF